MGCVWQPENVPEFDDGAVRTPHHVARHRKPPLWRRVARAAGPIVASAAGPMMESAGPGYRPGQYPGTSAIPLAGSEDTVREDQARRLWQGQAPVALAGARALAVAC